MTLTQSMNTVAVLGRPRFDESKGGIPPTPRTDIDDALSTLQAHKDHWAMLDIKERIVILDEIMRDMRKVAPRWVAAAMEAQGLHPDTYGETEKIAILSMVLRLIRLLRHSLIDIQRYGQPRIPGALTERPNGQVVAQVFPQFWHDRLVMMGVKAEVWMKPGVSSKNGGIPQASFYNQKSRDGRVAFVLGAGNVSALVPADFMYKLFVEGQVVILKPNPVNEYIGPLLEEGFRALIKRGYMRVVYGGREEGAYLVSHPAVDEIHMTGSDKTFEAIVFGPGDEGAKRKADRNPKITKRFTAELGNISPVIVVPGPWTTDEIRAQAAKLGTWLSTNAGFGCLTPRVIINWKGWDSRNSLNQAIGEYLSRVETRAAYYPGAFELHQRFVAEHPDSSMFGDVQEGHLPWTLIEDVDSNNKDDICFNCEAFTSIFAETALQADNVADYIKRAVNFANEQLWGTLVASIIIHPKSLKDPKIAAAVDQAVEKLRYGTVVINNWGVLAYLLMLTSWGGYPGQDIYNVQSGIGVVNNVLMFDHPQKSVVRAPFIQSPDPFDAKSKHPNEFGIRLADYQYSPSIGSVVRLFRAVMKT